MARPIEYSEIEPRTTGLSDINGVEMKEGDHVRYWDLKNSKDGSYYDWSEIHSLEYSWKNGCFQLVEMASSKYYSLPKKDWITKEKYKVEVT